MAPAPYVPELRNGARYEIPEVSIGTRKPIRVVTVGAGYSGLMVAIMFNEKMKDANAELTIYEKHAELGGTWLVNRYPGCKCDIPAHNYSYSFCAKPDWPNYYATSQQIHDYMKDVASKFSAEKYIKFEHSVQAAIWDDSKAKWKLTIRSPSGEDFVDECDVFINAGGILSKWKWPTIKGIETFKGKLMHSAAWDNDYDFSGKRVACIGIGSSGIQIVPQLAKVVKSMDCFVRTQTWVSPAPGINEPTANDPGMDSDYNFTDKSLQLFEDPKALRDYRVALMDRRIDNFKRAMADSEQQRNAQAMFRHSMTERLGETDKGRKAAEHLLPDFPVGCRRQTPGVGFLEAIIQDNIEMRWDDIVEITERGIKSRSGQDLEYDVIVCATGFDTSFKPAFPIIGRGGVSLAEKWTQDRPKAYFGICVPDMPNYFCFIGPNSCVSNGSLVIAIEMTAIYIYQWLRKFQTETIRSFCVSEDATEEYNEHMQEYLKRTVWTRGCRSWYKRGTVDGPVVAIYGGTTFHFIEALKHPRWEDFELERTVKSNRFAYLGNGFTKRESRGGSVGATQTLDFDEFFDLFVLPDIHG